MGTLDRDYLTFLVNELKLDTTETDANGKDAITHCFENYRKDHMTFLITELGANLNLPTLP